MKIQIALSAVAVSSVSAAEWSYDAHEEWSVDYEHCGGTAQSPIDIPAGGATVDTKLATALDCSFAESLSGSIENNGHSLELALSDQKATHCKGIPSRTAGDTYYLNSVHMHWGSDDTQGSEHYIDGTQYAMEMHMVFYNGKYGDLASAKDQNDGLSVIGILFKASGGDDDGNDEVEKFATSSGTVSLESEDLLEVGDDSSFLDNKRFYTYSGSLTTPPCFESVQWIVAMDQGSIGSSALDALRSLKDSHGEELVDNFRPLQDLGSRTVKASAKQSGGSDEESGDDEESDDGDETDSDN